MSELKKYGLLKAVPGSESGLELQKCSQPDVCEDNVKVETKADTLLRGIIINGEEKQFDKNYAANDPNLNSAVDAAIGHYEASPKHVDASYDGSAVNIIHRGATVVGSLVDSNGTTLAATVTRKCTIANICQFKAGLSAAAANAPNLTVVDSNGNEVINNDFEGDYSTVNKVNAEQLQSDIDGELAKGVSLVEVNSDNTGYDVILNLPEGFTASLGGVDFIKGACEYIFAQ